MDLSRRVWPLLAAGALGFAAAGCQSQPSASSPNSAAKENERIQQQALDKENAASPSVQPGQPGQPPR